MGFLSADGLAFPGQVSLSFESYLTGAALLSAVGFVAFPGHLHLSFENY